MNKPRATSRLLVGLLAMGTVMSTARSTLAAPGDLGTRPVSSHVFGSFEQRSSSDDRVEFLSQVYAPADPGLSETFPVVLLMHGGHATCYNSAIDDVRNEMPCPEGYDDIPNYQGYNYLAHTLASHGIIAVSVSVNGTVLGNGQDDLAAARVDLIDEHLDFLEAHLSGPFRSYVDRTRVGLVGHSRGGQAVTSYGSQFPTKVSAIFALAPYLTGPVPPPQVPYATMVGYCDGDVDNLNGLRFYDDGRYTDLQSQAERYAFFLPGGNHNYFNSVWTPPTFSASEVHQYDDAVVRVVRNPQTQLAEQGPGPYENDGYCDPSLSSQRLEGIGQQDVARGYILAFMRKYLRGETQFDAILKGEAPVFEPDPFSVLPLSSRVAYHPGPGDRLDINRLNDAALEQQGENSLGEAVNETAVSSGICDGACGSPRRTHNSERLLVNWSSALARYSNELPASHGDISRFEVLQFRVAVVPGDPSNSPGQSQNFSLVIRDAAGEEASVRVADHRASALAHPPGTLTNTPAAVMTTVRVPVGAFSGVDITSINSVDFRFNVRASGAVTISDLALADRTADVATVVTGVL